MVRNTFCANCMRDLSREKETGESGLYSPDKPFELCVSCFHWEYDLITEEGNNLPELLAKYKKNCEGELP